MPEAEGLWFHNIGDIAPGEPKGGFVQSHPSAPEETKAWFPVGQVDFQVPLSQPVRASPAVPVTIAV